MALTFYHYDAAGKMIGAIRPPEAIIPLRVGQRKISPPAKM